MTMTIDISPETEAYLEREAARQGRELADYTRQSFEIWLRLSAEPESEETLFEEMRLLSLPTLEEYWINDADAIYDTW